MRQLLPNASPIQVEQAMLNLAYDWAKLWVKSGPIHLAALTAEPHGYGVVLRGYVNGKPDFPMTIVLTKGQVEAIVQARSLA